MELTEEQIEKVALDFVKKPGMQGYIEVGDLMDFARALLAAHSAGAQDAPVAWMYQSEDPFDGGEWFLSDTKPNRRNIRPLYSHPQPMPQTDAARDVMDHETALRGCRILSNIVSAYDEGNHGGRVIHLIGVAKSWIAELERLDRATGE